MRDASAWGPTKYVHVRGELRANPALVGYGSRWMVELQAAAYQRMLREHAAGTLVDVGCGSAPLYGEYRGRVREVVLVDWDASAHPSPCVDVRCDLNLGIPVGSATADTVLASDVLEHLHRPEVLFAESARVLRPGGKLLLGVPFLYWIHEEPHDYHRYTEFRLRQLCAGAGLVALRLDAIGGPADVLRDVSAKLAAGSPALRVAHRCALAAARCATALTRWRPDAALARAFPLAYALVAQKPNPGAPA